MTFFVLIVVNICTTSWEKVLLLNEIQSWVLSDLSWGEQLLKRYAQVHGYTMWFNGNEQALEITHIDILCRINKSCFYVYNIRNCHSKPVRIVGFA